MCGIAGFSLAPRTRVDALDIARSLTLAIERRGPHATGAAWSEDDHVWFHKQPVTARRYVRNMPVAPTARTAILHTRFATGGVEADPSDNENNHPFSLPGVTGIHNGVVRNHEAIFEMLDADPISGTDSEAIFALLADHDWEHPTDALALVDGDAAVAWLEPDRPDTLHLARLEGRPLHIAQTVTGATFFSSTAATLDAGLRGTRAKVTWRQDVPEWTYLRVHAGRIDEATRFASSVARPRARVEAGRLF